MPKQPNPPTLFDRPSYRARARSREARDHNRPNAATERERVLSLLRDRGDHGATDQEMQTELQMSGNTQRPRRKELEKAGKVIDSGRTRKTSSGCSATVWIVDTSGTTNAAPSAAPR